MNYWDEEKRIPAHHKSRSIEISRFFNWIWYVKNKGKDNPEWFIFHESANYWIAFYEYAVLSIIASDDEDKYIINNDKVVILSDEVIILSNKVVILNDEIIILNRTWHKIDY